MTTKRKKVAISNVPLGHTVAHAKLDDLKSQLDQIFERHVDCRKALEDFVFWHITDAHPECPPHDEDDHGPMCCVFARASAALLQADLNMLGHHPCSGTPPLCGEDARCLGLGNIACTRECGHVGTHANERRHTQWARRGDDTCTPEGPGPFTRKKAP
jgi:hypothetical protein